MRIILSENHFIKHTQQGYSMALEFGILNGLFLYQFAVLHCSIWADKVSCKGCSKRETKRMYK
jgi:hypothetical protein